MPCWPAVRPAEIAPAGPCFGSKLRSGCVRAVAHTARRLEREEKTQYLDELKQRCITIDSEAELLRRAFQSKNSGKLP